MNARWAHRSLGMAPPLQPTLPKPAQPFPGGAERMAPCPAATT